MSALFQIVGQFFEANYLHLRSVISPFKVRSVFDPYSHKNRDKAKRVGAWVTEESGSNTGNGSTSLGVPRKIQVSI